MERAIRRRLLSFLAGRGSVDDLHAWLVAETWALDERRRPNVARLAFGALLAIAEYEERHITLGRLRDRLLTVAQTSYFGDPSKTRTESSSFTQPENWALRRFVAVGRPREEVSV